MMSCQDQKRTIEVAVKKGRTGDEDTAAVFQQYNMTIREKDIKQERTQDVNSNKPRYWKKMNSQKHKSTTESMVKKELTEDEDISIVFPEEINKHWMYIKQECSQDTSTDSKHLGDNTSTNPSFQSHWSYKILNNEMTTVVSSQEQSGSLECGDASVLDIKEEITVEEECTPVYTDFDVHEAEIKKECAQVGNTGTADVCGVPEISDADFSVNHEPNNSEKDNQRLESMISGNKSNSCRFCEKTFSNKNNLIGHERIHTGEKPYSCGYCSKKFSIKGNLISHEKTHSGEKSFACEHCSKKFSRKSYVMEHERIHTGEKPYSCGYCSKTFSMKSNLVSHEKNHIGEKTFVCEYCSKRFSRKTYLIEHERIHTGEKPYSCGYCSKKFSIKGNLICHEKNHSGEKSFACEYCSKKFSRKSYLIIHERIHTGEKPYSCELCSKVFARNSDLKSHQKFHSGEEKLFCNWGYSPKTYSKKK